MSRYISESLRRLIAERAKFRCEYCLVSESNSFYTFQVDHIKSIKHGGTSDPENLAFACIICNRNKGSDLGTMIGQADDLIRFFNPRKDKWSDHFEVTKSGVLNAKTPIGAATIKVFDLNHADSVSERKFLVAAKKYP